MKRSPLSRRRKTWRPTLGALKVILKAALGARKVKSLFTQVDSSGDGTLNLEEPLGIALPLLISTSAFRIKVFKACGVSKASVLDGPTGVGAPRLASSVRVAAY